MWELVVLLLVVLLVFGPKRLPDMGRQLGSSLRELKAGIAGDRSDDAAPPSHNS